MRDMSVVRVQWPDASSGAVKSWVTLPGPGAPGCIGQKCCHGICHRHITMAAKGGPTQRVGQRSQIGIPDLARPFRRHGHCVETPLPVELKLVGAGRIDKSGVQIEGVDFAIGSIYRHRSHNVGIPVVIAAGVIVGAASRCGKHNEGDGRNGRVLPGPAR